MSSIPSQPMDLVVNAPIKKFLRDRRAQQLQDHFLEHRELYERAKRLAQEADDLMCLPRRTSPKVTQEATVQSLLDICGEMSHKESPHSLHNGLKRSFVKSFLWYEDEGQKLFRDIPASLDEHQGTVSERQLKYSYNPATVYFGDIGRAELVEGEEELEGEDDHVEFDK